MAKKEAVRQSNLSEEIVHDSSDEEEQETPRPQKKTKTKTTAQIKPASQSTTTTTTSDDEDAEESSSQSSAVDDNSDAESTSSSSSSSKKRSSDSVPESPVKKARKKASYSNVRIAPKAYKAPSGYEPLALSASDYTSDVATLLDDLDGKQIWHISVPDSVSIESIKSFDMQAAMRGESIFSKDGVNYNLHYMPSTHGHETLLMPQGAKSAYKRAAVIERNFQLREMGDHVDTSNKKARAQAQASVSTDGETAGKEKEQQPTPLVFTATGTGKPKAIRQQPQGLKMRYFPYGSKGTSEEPEDVEMADTFQVPDEIPEPSPKKKSKKSKAESQGSIGGESANPEKKKKKKRKLVDADVL
ncbi:hypothetical protein RBB50_007213 [Rhinocladiella similis]